MPLESHDAVPQRQRPIGLPARHLRPRFDAQATLPRPQRHHLHSTADLSLSSARTTRSREQSYPRASRSVLVGHLVDVAAARQQSLGLVVSQAWLRTSVSHSLSLTHSPANDAACRSLAKLHLLVAQSRVFIAQQQSPPKSTGRDWTTPQSASLHARCQCQVDALAVVLVANPQEPRADSYRWPGRTTAGYH